MLEIKNVWKTFNKGTVNEKQALCGVNLTLNDGDFCTVIGGNGAGKSTTLNAIAGVWPVDCGQILIDGKDISALPEHKRAPYLGRVFQDPMTGTVADMEIIEIKENKKQFLPLLLLADEQESMIDRYIDRGMMYVLVDNGVKCECVVTDEGKGILEIKNIATVPEYQGKGYGKALIDFVAAKYKGKYSILQVGTGDSPLTVPFYEKSGFVRSHSIKNFFIDNYDHPIFEGGVQLTDMIYLQKKI